MAVLDEGLFRALTETPIFGGFGVRISLSSVLSRLRFFGCLEKVSGAELQKTRPGSVPDFLTRTYRLGPAGVAADGLGPISCMDAQYAPTFGARLERRRSYGRCDARMFRSRGACRRPLALPDGRWCAGAAAARRRRRGGTARSLDA